MTSIMDALGQVAAEETAPTTAATVTRPGREETFRVFLEVLQPVMPAMFFEYLWSLVEEVSDPRKSVVMQLADHGDLYRQVLDARSLVVQRYAAAERRREMRHDQLEIIVRPNLAKPTIDLVRATIYDQFPDYVELVRLVDTLGSLKEYMDDLRSLCIARQIIVQERSERDRSGHRDEGKAS